MELAEKRRQALAETLLENEEVCVCVCVCVYVCVRACVRTCVCVFSFIVYYGNIIQ